MATITQTALLEEFEVTFETEPSAKGTPVDLLPLEDYGKILVSMSGGKDSVGCLFKLLDLGVDPSKIELWHQSVDGKGQTEIEFMDWPFIESYIDAIGQYFNIPVRYQWRAFGIHGEMHRRDSLTGDVYYINEQGETICLPTTNGKKSTRMMWPAMAADLRTRWCSAYAKIDVFRKVLNNYPTFKGTKEGPTKVLVVTGERREESPNRARYLEAELHPCNTSTRIVHSWRPVIDLLEKDIWEMFEKRRFMPALPYQLGWSRTSCFGCIFSTSDLWAMMREIAPERFNRLVEVERELEHTIDKKFDLVTKANMGSLDRLTKDARRSEWVEKALTRGSIKPSDLILDKWELPCGAFKGSAGGSL